MISGLNRSLFTQLMFIIAGASIIAVVASTIGHYFFTSRIIKDSIDHQMISALQLSTDYLEENYSKKLHYDLNLLGSSSETTKLLANNSNKGQTEQENIEQFFLSLLNSQKKLYLSIRLIDKLGKERIVVKDGKILRKYRDIKKLHPTPRNLVTSDLFLQLKKSPNGTIIFSQPAFEGEKPYFFVGITQKDHDSEKFEGAIIISFTLDNFIKYSDKFKVFNYPIVWLFTHSGEAIHTVKEENSISPFPFLYGNTKKPKDFLIYSSKKLPKNSIQNIIQIAISAPPKAKQSLINSLIFITLSILLTITSASFIIAFFITKRILAPINHLTKISQRVAAGDFSVNIPIKGNDELATLSQAFNIMIQELDEQRYELRSLANKDTLTQLPNRRQFEAHLSVAVKSCSRNNQSIAVIYLDLDQFKDTNDSFGHPAGDKLIRDVSERLLKTVRQSDLVARLGGDEFAIILNPHKTKVDTEHVAKKILFELNKPFFIEKQQIFSGGSIGISIYPEHGRDATTLVKNADAAMYKAKSMGRNRYQFYSTQLTTKANERVVLGALIRNAVANSEFTIHYQPKISLITKEIIGAEALLRWEHKGQTVLPSKIISIAESSGFIEKIDAWVIHATCAQIKQWRQSEVPITPISINISGRMLEGYKIINILKQVLHKYSLDPKWIEIEITENDLISNNEQTQKALKIIHRLGVKIAIDDFGTGYSSLSYLKDLLADTLKIDRKFVVNAMKNHADRKIATAIVKLARSLNMHVVVEGIETREQEELFKNLGAHSAQGYLYAKPMPQQQFVKLLKAEFNTEESEF